MILFQGCLEVPPISVLVRNSPLYLLFLISMNDLLSSDQDVEEPLDRLIKETVTVARSAHTGLCTRNELPEVRVKSDFRYHYMAHVNYHYFLTA